MIRRLRGESASAAPGLLVVVLLLLNLRSAHASLEYSRDIPLCSGGGSIDIAANESWQRVTAVILEGVPAGGRKVCTITLSVATASPASSDAISSTMLLLKLVQVQLMPPEQKCDLDASSLALYTTSRSRRTGYVCNKPSIEYILTSSNVSVYVQLNDRFAAAARLFAFAFAAVSATNVCYYETNSRDVKIESVHYVFAPDRWYAIITPLIWQCLVGFNYTRSFVAASSSDFLRLTVLAGPSTKSCSLCVGNKCFNDADTYTFEPGELVSLRFSCAKCGLNDVECISGFTSTLETGRHILSSEASTKPSGGAADSASHADSALVAGASAAAALAIVVAVIVSVVLVRRRRTPSSPAQAAPNTMWSPDLPLLANDTAKTDHGTSYRHSGGACKQSPICTRPSVSQGINAQCDMVDNDLYGRAFCT